MIDTTPTAARPRMGTASRATRRAGRTRRLFLVDVAVFTFFALVINVPLTGIAIHEWLGLAIAIGLVVHLAQHADWVASIGGRLFGRTSFQNRANYLAMLGLFVGFASITVSGLMISESALPFVGIDPPAGSFWFWLHVSSVGWVIALTAVHIAMNWRWITSTSERLVFAPVRNRRGRP